MKLHKISSREFIVFIVATILLVLSKLDSQSWILVAMAFMGFRTWQKIKGV